MENRRNEREDMVRRQIRGRGVRGEKLLSALVEIPRHIFVPEPERAYAYEDCPLPIGYGQTISQPFMVAYMIEALLLEGTETILEIGTGSGYQTALLARLSAEVHSVERIRPLSRRAAVALKELGIKNADLIVGDGYAGLSLLAPFDAIIVSAAPPFIPAALLEQVSPDNGRLVIPIGEAGNQVLVRITKSGRDCRLERLMAVAFVPMLPGIPDAG